MTIHTVKEYYAEVEKMIHFGGTKKETAIRNAFYTLLNQYAGQRGLMLVPEITIKTAKGKNITPDGTIKDALRQDWGYWESKDEADDIDDEIAKKFAKGYPRDNILFEDSRTAVLYQGGEESLRVSMQDAEALDRIIRAFINYERPEVTNFRTAIALFRDDIPKVTDSLRDLIATAEANNPAYVKRRDEFFRLCQEVINPAITKEDIFHYVYAVLHCPAYREKYDLNLKREFPRISCYDNFHKWRDWGKELMELHTDFETVPPFDLRIFTNSEIKTPGARLKADKEKGQIMLDDATTLAGVPSLAWDYRLGNRSALEWVLEQYKEKKPKDPTIAEKFNTYRFSNYKEKVIDLLKRVCTVSVATMKIIKEMEKEGNAVYNKPEEE